MIEKINNYLNNNKFYYTVYENYLHIINYNKIVNLDNNRITVLANKMKVVFTSNNFKLIKLLDNEMLLETNITKIEVYYD